MTQCLANKDSPIILEQFDLTQPERQQYRLNATMKVLKEIDSNMVVCNSELKTVSDEIVRENR